nr:reverse transcriptase domain-containing protein [Tanacetum cinerariifolium]
MPNSEPVVTPIIEPVVAPVSAPKPNQKASILYPSRFRDQKLCDKANDQKEKFFRIFNDLDFNINIYNDMMANRIDVIDMACKEYSQEVLGFSDVIATFVNDDPSLPPPNQEYYLPQVRKEHKICEAKTDKSSIDEPSKVELKDLPPYLKYAFLEGDDKLPIKNAKDLSDEEKAALITVLKSHKRAIAWKLFDIKGINPEFVLTRFSLRMTSNQRFSTKGAIAITLDLPTVEPKDSLRMGDEHLDTILKTESEEFIKSSVENLVPSPSESEDLSDMTTIHFMMKTFRRKSIRTLFDEEIISIKIDPHHFNAKSDLIESLLNHDSSIISSSLKIDSLLDEFASELTLLKTIPPGIDETDRDPEEVIRLIEKLLYDNLSPRLLEEFIFENSDAAIESFFPSPILVENSDSFIEEIDLSFTLNDSMPPGIEEDDYDSERDILILEELLSNDSLSNHKTSHFILIFHHPLVLLRNHQMMIQEF